MITGGKSEIIRTAETGGRGLSSTGTVKCRNSIFLLSCYQIEIRAKNVQLLLLLLLLLLL
jgi:hypothetical protein